MSNLRNTFLLAFLVSLGSAFQKTRTVSSELDGGVTASQLQLREVEPAAAHPELPTDPSTDSDSAIVHVTIDIEELPEPDNQTIVDTGWQRVHHEVTESAKSVETSLNSAVAAQNLELKAKLFSLQAHAKNATDGVLDGLVELLVDHNCSSDSLLHNYSVATGLHLKSAVSKSTASKDGACIMVVNSSTADAMVQQMVDEHENGLAASAKATFLAEALQLQQSTQAAINRSVENSSTMFHRATRTALADGKNISEAMAIASETANATFYQDMSDILSEMDSKLTLDLDETLATASQDMDEFVDATLTLSLSRQTYNASLGPLPDLKKELASAHTMLDKADSLVAELEKTSRQVKEAAFEAVLARTTREAASKEMAHYVNVSIEKNYEASEALTGMLDGKYDPQAVTNLTAAAQQAATAASQAGTQQAEQDQIFQVAEQKHSKLANQEYRMLAALTAEMEGVLTHVSQALEDGADEEEDVKSLSEELNLTVMKENDSSPEVAATTEGSTTSKSWFDAVGGTLVNATQTVINATDSLTTATEAASDAANQSSTHAATSSSNWLNSIGDSLANATQAVSNATAAASDAVTAAANTSGDWLSSITNQVNSTSDVVANLSNLTKAIAGVGRSESLLQSSARLAGADSNPGTVTIHISVESGNQSLVDSIINGTEANLKDVLGSEAANDVSARVVSSDNSRNLTVQATIPDVSSESVQEVVDSTATAVQDVLGDDTQTSGQVSSSEEGTVKVESSEEVLEQATKAAEIFDENSAPQRETMETSEDNGMESSETADKEEEVQVSAAEKASSGQSSPTFPTWLGILGLLTVLALGILILQRR